MEDPSPEQAGYFRFFQTNIFLETASQGTFRHPRAEACQKQKPDKYHFHKQSP
jgi:hypothetical protein